MIYHALRPVPSHELVFFKYSMARNKKKVVFIERQGFILGRVFTLTLFGPMRKRI